MALHDNSFDLRDRISLYIIIITIHVGTDGLDSPFLFLYSTIPTKTHFKNKIMFVKYIFSIKRNWSLLTPISLQHDGANF